MTDFAGIPLAGADFFGELRFNNERAWWLANKERWERDVRRPLTQLCSALEGEFGAAKLFRPYRDTRFSADKTPYKDHQGCVVMTGPAMGLYVQLSTDGLMTGGGWYEPIPEMVARYRAAVHESPGAELVRIIDDLEQRGFEIGGDLLKTAPRGFTSDHPRIGLLRRKHLLASVQHGTPDWLSTPDAVAHVRADWLTYRPLLDWLAAHVG